MENERNGKYLETSVRVLQNVSTSIVVRGLDDLTFLATHSPAEFFVQKGKVCYESEDYHQAVMYFSQALRLDPQNAEAQFMMGAMYNSGQGVARDYVEAVKWFLNAAEQGHTQAQYNLGRMYQNGRGVQQDAPCGPRQISLWELMYANRQGVPQDYIEAEKWYRKAAEQGDASAQNNLGLMYHEGQGVPQDYIEAIKWYRKAAEQGHAHAQCNLGVGYYGGQGVARDYVEAVKWFLNAAEQGHTQAQYNVGLMYWRGEGAPQDFVKAHMWLDLSAAQGDSDAKKYRDELAERMSPSQLAEAERLAMEWKHRGNLTIIENP